MEWGVLRLEKNGDSLWLKVMGDGDAPMQRCYGVTQLPTGEIIACGRWAFQEDSIEISYGYIVCYAANGDTLWSRKVVDPSPIANPPNNGYLHAITTNHRGNAVVAGHVFLEIDRFGNVIWTNPDPVLLVNDIKQLPDSSYLFVTYGHVGRLSITGEVEWAAFHGNPELYYYDAVPSSDGGFVTAGVLFPPSGPLSIIALRKLNCHGVLEEDASCFAKPAQPVESTVIANSPANVLTVQVPEDLLGHKLTLHVVDAAGRRVLVQELPAASPVQGVGVDALAAGVYTVVVSGGGDPVVRKVFIYP